MPSSWRDLAKNVNEIKPRMWMRSSPECEWDLSQWGWDLAHCLERLTTSAKVATVLGSIPASSYTVKSEGRQMKPCWNKVHKKYMYKLFIYVTSSDQYSLLQLVSASFDMTVRIQGLKSGKRLLHVLVKRKTVLGEALYLFFEKIINMYNCLSFEFDLWSVLV